MAVVNRNDETMGWSWRRQGQSPLELVRVQGIDPPTRATWMGWRSAGGCRCRMVEMAPGQTAWRRPASTGTGRDAVIYTHSERLVPAHDHGTVSPSATTSAVCVMNGLRTAMQRIPSARPVRYDCLTPDLADGRQP